jgi:uncharacterized repeat protein (TIGR03803 family)
MKTKPVQKHASARWAMSRSLSVFVQLACLLLLITMAQAQTYTVLHTFIGKGDGEAPEARLVQGSDGALYGTTYGGGSFDMGAIFKLDLSGRETVLRSYWGGDGLAPGDSILDREGVLYGVTWDGGTPEGGGWGYGSGTVFKLDKTGKYTILHRFNGKPDGGGPEGPLIQGAKGNLYGITNFGGDLTCGSYLQGCGVIFKLDTTGKETVVHTFKTSDGLEYPGPVIRDNAGNFYGAAQPINQAGLVFKLDSSGKVTALHNFTGGADGYGPIGPLLSDAAGNLYGVAAWGGEYSCGLVFKLDPTGKETVLHQFQGPPGDGCGPRPMIRDRAGNFYGTTEEGGSGGGYGTVFKVQPSGNETVLYSFAGGSNGALPWTLFLDKADVFYGTTAAGGNTSCYARDYVPGCGVVFKLTP